MTINFFRHSRHCVAEAGIQHTNAAACGGKGANAPLLSSFPRRRESTLRKAQTTAAEKPPNKIEMLDKFRFSVDDNAKGGGGK